MSGNYSEIVKNNYAILDMFKKLKDRENRVRSAANDNQVKFYRAFKQNKIELDLKRGNFKVENDFVKAQMNAGILSTKGNTDDGGCNAKVMMTKPGFGKYDLDTGLTISRKIAVRSQAAQKGLKKDAYQLYMQRKEDPLARYPREQSDAVFMTKVGSHGRDIKDGKVACSHINDGKADIESPFSPNLLQQQGSLVDGIGKKTLSEEELEELKNQQEQIEHDEEQFRLIYEQQRLRNLEIQREYQKDEYSSMMPLVKQLFSDKTDLTNEITHVKYMEIMENEEMAEQVITCLRRKHQKDIIAFGHEKFKKLVRENQDRRYLFKFIRNELSFDQFTTRAICETRGVKFFCVEDLLQKGISPHYFQNVSSVKKYLLAQHGVERIEDIKVADITFNCGQGKTLDDYFEDTSYDEITTQRIKKMINEDLQLNKWKCNKRCLKSNFTIIDKKTMTKNEERIRESEVHANRQKFCKTSTFRLNIPINPLNNQKTEEQEHEDLLNDQTKYIKRLLKQNFSKYRNKNKVQPTKTEEPQQLAQGLHQRSFSALSSVQRPVSGMSNPRQEGFSEISQIHSNEAGNSKAMSKVPSKSRVNSVMKSEVPETQVTQPISQQFELTSGKKDNAQTQKKRDNKLGDKLKTRQDLLFIRLLQESGVTIYSDPEIQLNLLYDWERDEHFRKLKKKVEVKKKKGPRQILNPHLNTIQFQNQIENQGFDPAQFKARLEETISKKIGPKVLQKIKANYTEHLNNSILKIVVNQDDSYTQQPILTKDQGVSPEQFHSNLDHIVRITHDYLDSDVVQAQIMQAQEENAQEVRQVHQKLVSHVTSEPGVLSLKETEARDISSSKSPIQEHSPMILEKRAYGQSFAKNSRENLLDQIQVKEVVEDTTTHRREQRSNRNLIPCARPQSPPQLTKTIIQQQIVKPIKVASDHASTGDGNFSNATVSQVASKQELSPTGLYQQQQKKERVKSAIIGGRQPNTVNPMINSIDPSVKIDILNSTINQNSEIQNFLDHNINIVQSTQFGNRRWRNDSVNFSHNRAIAQKYKDKIAMQGKQMSLDIPMEKSQSGIQSTNASRYNKMTQKHTRNMSAITSQSPKRCIGQKGRFVLSSVNERDLNNSQNISLAGMLDQQQRQNYGKQMMYLRNAGVANSTNFAPILKSPAGEETSKIFGDGGWKDNTSMSTSFNPMSHVAINIQQQHNVRNSMVNVKSEDTHYSPKSISQIQRTQLNHKDATLQSQDQKSLHSAAKGGFTKEIFYQEKKIRPMSSAGGGFRIQSKDRNIGKQRISRDFKFSQNRNSQQLSSKNQQQEKKIQSTDKVEFMDLQNLKNLLSTTNSSDQKLIQYIKSIGFHVNDSNAVIQNSSAHGTITESDFKNYIDFQKQCQKLHEEIQNQNTIGSKNGHQQQSQSEHEFQPKFLPQTGGSIETPSLYDQGYQNPAPTEMKHINKESALSSRRSVIKTQGPDQRITETDRPLLEIGLNAQESLVNKKSWVEMPQPTKSVSMEEETHKHTTSQEMSKTDMNPGSQLQARQEDDEDVIVHVSSQMDLQAQDKLEQEPVVPEFVNGLKDKYGDIDFSGEEQILRNSQNIKHEQLDLRLQVQLDQDKSIIDQKGRYSVKQNQATEDMLKKFTMQVGVQKVGTPHRNMEELGQKKSKLGRNTLELEETQEVDLEDSVNQTIQQNIKPTFYPARGFNQDIAIVSPVLEGKKKSRDQGV